MPMKQPSYELPRDTVDALRKSAHAHDLSGEWPATDLIALERVNALRWAVPREFGGEALDPLEIHLRYEAVASASLATALILTQRDSAIGIIAGSANEQLKRELLPKIASGEMFTTVGIAQLTTSRQGATPALRAVETSIGYEIDGVIPWSSGAAHAPMIVAGAAVEGTGGKQILFALPNDLAGVSALPPMRLAALRATATGEVRCHHVALDRRLVLAGPVANVLATRKHVLPLGQAFLGLGHVRGILDLVATHDSDRGRALHHRLALQLEDLRIDVLAAARPDAPADAGPRLRGACGDLAIRAAHSAVALFKGSALLETHPAQRLAREAMFLLVWSCPDPVIDCTVELLSST